MNKELCEAIKNHENRIDMLEEKNIITARLESNHTIQATSSSETIKSFSEYSKKGTKLSVANGAVKIRRRCFKS